MDYQEFVKQKITMFTPGGHEPTYTHKALFPFQSDISRWAIRRGKSAIFADCGLGKTLMQLYWADDVSKYTGGKVLILAPLAVSSQTAKEGIKFGVDVTICREQKDATGMINITNYEMLHKFDAAAFVGIVLDESSLLKSYSGKYRNEIISSFSDTPYKLACTATPSPNDYMELGNHSEFLGAMTRAEMLSMFFIHDGGDTSKWRLKGHAESEFWKWLCSWAVMIRKPSDIGYSDGGFVLPDLNMHSHVIKNGKPANGKLFVMQANTLMERRQARRKSLHDRCAKAAELANSNDEQWLVWCDLNDESAELTKLINGAEEVKGSDSNEHKIRVMDGFAGGSVRVLVTKPSIAGFGLNLQNCHNMVFVGLSDSYESYYQAVRRCWRFGQNNDVNVYVVTAEEEGAVVSNILRKEADADRMASEMVRHMADITSAEIRGTEKHETHYFPAATMTIPSFWRGQYESHRSGKRQKMDII